MKNFDNILIISDIDKTFLNSETKPVEANYKAVRRFISQGGSFTFATGRAKDLDRVVPEFYSIVNAPAIMCNGAFIYDFKTGKKYSELFIDAAETAAVVKAALGRYPSLEGYYTTETDVYNMREHLEKNADKRWYKAVFIDEYEILCRLRGEISGSCGERYSYTMSNTTFLELLNPAATKGTMLQNLKKLYAANGRDIKVYAIGDFENDLDMLKKADVSACPSNAIRMIKNVADNILCSNDEGAVAQLIDIIMSV